MSPAADWWKTFFRPSRFPIDELTPADQTAAEVRALRRLLPPPPSMILDVACGTGRHSVPLARLGYRVTGADQSATYLAAARLRAARKRAGVRFLKRDMRRLGLDQAFDAAINLWTSFGYFPSPSQDVVALRSIRKALRPGGLLVLEIVNGDHVRRFLQPRYWHPAGRGWLLEENRFRGGSDPAVLTYRIHVDAGGKARGSPTFLRHYDRARLTAALKKAGFARVRIRSGLLEPAVPAGIGKRLVALAWRGYETR